MRCGGCEDEDRQLQSRVGGRPVVVGGVGADRQSGTEGEERAGLLSSPGGGLCLHHEEDLQSWLSQGIGKNIGKMVRIILLPRTCFPRLR